jgi:required for meiotic nuclear division protein 1
MRIPLRAWFFHSIVDIKKLKPLFPGSLADQDDALLIDLPEERRVCVTAFGAVVFWPFDERIAREVTDRIKTIMDDPTLVEAVEDKLVVETDKGESRVSFNEVWLAGAASPPLVFLVSQLLGQSVALEYLELEVDRALERFRPLLERVVSGGRVRASGRDILQAIGFSMQTRYFVLNNLALFDRPESTWESEDLAILFPNLYELFELGERHQNLSRRLSFLAESGTLLSDLLGTRKSHRLEWIVIILIGVEIVMALIQEAILLLK